MNHRAKIPPPMSVVGQEPKKIEGDGVARQISTLLNYFSKTFRGLEPKSMKILVDPGCAEENLGPVLNAQLGLPVYVMPRNQFFADLPAEASYTQLVALAAAGFRSRPFFGRASRKPMNLLASHARKGSFFDVTPLNWEQEKRQLKRLAVLEVSVIAAVFLLFIEACKLYRPNRMQKDFWHHVLQSGDVVQLSVRSSQLFQ